MRPKQRAGTSDGAGDPASRLELAPALGQVTVVAGDDNGRYPHGNSVLVRGRHLSVLIDPSLTIGRWGAFPAHVDVALLSHVHEDHVAGLAAVPDADVHVHWRDQPALRSVDDFVASYGLRASAQPAMRQLLLEEFGFRNRPDALPFDDGDRLEVGGSVITAIHLPGHTPGHCGFLIEPEGVMVLGDIDLTGFGPYYADRGSDLAEMEASLARCRSIDAAWYVTFHHKGVVEGREAFLTALDRYESAIGRRDQQLLARLDRPHSLDELVAGRLLYRPHVDLIWADSAEEHTIRRHLDRLRSSGAVVVDGAGRFVRSA